MAARRPIKHGRKICPTRIALVTDSTCDIPAEWIRQYEITVVPLTIIFGSEQFLDGVEL